MKKVILVTAGLMIGSILMAQQARSQRRGYDQGVGIDRKEMMKERLNLSENQEEEIQSIRTKFLRNIQATENQLDIKRAELKAAISSEASKKEIDGFVSEINSLSNQRFEKEIDHMLEVRAILDNEQKVIFDAMAGRLDKGQMQKRKHSRY